MGLKRASWLAAAVALAAGAAFAGPITPLAQSPTLNRDQIVFAWADHLWSVPRAGGTARQITSAGHEAHPVFSPDGEWIAYRGEVDGNYDVYVVPAKGGAPRRLTFHPGVDEPVGWTPDGKSVLFTSTREAYANIQRLYTVPLEGGWQTTLPMWRAVEGTYSPDGARVAYVPNNKWQKEWKRYRGGQATPIWLARLGDLQVEKIPRDRSNDSQPVWVGDMVYFLSDRDGPVTLYGYDTRTKAVRRLIDNRGLDLKTLSGGADGLVYEQFGSVHVYSLADGTSRKVDIRVDQAPPGTLPQKVDAAEDIENVALSPEGGRLAVEARGEILAGPAAGGAFVNRTATSGVHERDPAWSPDGRFLAYLSDESGEYALHIAPADGAGAVKKLRVGDKPTFLEKPRWSPDGRKVIVGDAWENLWCVDLLTGASTKVDVHTALPVWSPDSRWLAYSKPLASGMHAVWLQSLETGRSVQVTDGLADARWPVFEAGGGLLAFAVSTDLGLSLTIQDMSGMNHPITRTIWAAVLRKDAPSPLGERAAEALRPAGPFRIDLDGLDRRITQLPIAAANYAGLQAGKAGVLVLEEGPIIQPRSGGRNGLKIKRFELASGKLELIAERTAGITLTPDGAKGLYRAGRRWFLVDAGAPAGAQPTALKLTGLEIQVDPRQEWREMFREAWRYERDFFYDPGLHGLDLAATQKKYAPFVEAAGSRDDLIYLFREMLGDLTIGHMAVESFNFHPPNGRRGGLLGADYKVENGRFRIDRIYDGEEWNPDNYAPLAGVGLNVKAGDYLLAVDGKDLRAGMDLYALFEGTAGRPTRLKIAADPEGAAAREVTVVPINDEYELRARAWAEDNRRKVDALSNGQIAYVRVPDTADEGFADFNRFYFSQVGKAGAIVDARFNTGGRFADYIVDMMERPLRNCAITRASGGYCVPAAQIYGPKTMITNEMSGSGGDALPWMFKTGHVGALVGARTWGGLVGGSGPSLLDGMGLATPYHAHYGLNGQWEVENHGVTPDYEVENDPASVAAGGDPQLQKAVEVTLEALRGRRTAQPAPPSYPVYQRP